MSSGESARTLKFEEQKFQQNFYLKSDSLFSALKLLKSDLTDIAKEATVDPKYILLYFYYGALILTAVKVSQPTSRSCTLRSEPIRCRLTPRLFPDYKFSYRHFHDSLFLN